MGNHDAGRRNGGDSQNVGRVPITRPSVNVVVGLIIVSLHCSTPYGEDIDREGRAGSASVCPMICAMAQETLAIEAGSGNLGNVVTDLGQALTLFHRQQPSGHFRGSGDRWSCQPGNGAQESGCYERQGPRQTLKQVVVDEQAEAAVVKHGDPVERIHLC